MKKILQKINKFKYKRLMVGFFVSFLLVSSFLYSPVSLTSRMSESSISALMIKTAHAAEDKGTTAKKDTKKKVESKGFSLSGFFGLSWDNLLLMINNSIVALIGALGSIVSLLIHLLVKIASYNDFINAEVVTLGWTTIRDVSNMFFIVILLIIAISTIIQVESYNYKKLLPKLLIMAVLINFSKMFAGLLIDFSQVVTLTFVNAFREAAGGNFVTGLGLTEILNFSAKNLGKLDNANIFTAVILGLIVTIVAIVVISALLLVFLFRIIALWILVILSPLAFLASAAGGSISKYSDQWWTQFGKYLIVGPVLAFFLWLSLAVMGSLKNTAAQDFLQQDRAKKETPESWGVSEMHTPESFVTFLISIAMLIGSLAAAQMIGVAGAGAAMGFAKRARGIAGKGFKGVGKGVRGAGSATAKWTAGQTLKQGGRLLGVAPGAAGLGGMVKSWGGDILASQKSSREKARLKTLGKLGMGDDTMAAYKTLLGSGKGTKAGKLGAGLAGAGAGATLGSIILPGVGTLLGGLVGGVTGFGTVSSTTRGAVDEGTKNLKAAQGKRKSAAYNDDYLATVGKNSFYNSDGQSGGQKKGFQVLADGSPEAKAAIDNYVKGINASSGTAEYSGDATLKNLAQGLAAYLKGGGSSSTDLDGLKSSLDASGRVPKSVDDYQNEIIANRKTEGKEMKEERGSLSTGTKFGKGESNDLMLDFRSLSEALKLSMGGLDFDVSAEGMNIKDSTQIGQISTAVNQMIESKIGQLDTTKDARQIGKLRSAQDRLAEPGGIKSLDLMNSGVDDPLSEFKRTKVHENLHSAGLKDEATTEAVANEIVETRNYSGVKDIGKMAAGLEGQGQSPLNIINAAVGEMSKRTSSRADNALAMEKSSVPTEKIEIPELGNITSALKSFGSQVGTSSSSVGLKVPMGRMTRSLFRIAKSTASLPRLGKEMSKIANASNKPLSIKVGSEHVSNTLSK